jgi:hypothetical protein
VLRYLTSVRPAARSPIEGAPVSGRFDIGTRVWTTFECMTGFVGTTS